MHATEISEKTLHLLFICYCIQGLGKFVPEFSKRAKSSTLLSSCKQRNSKTSPLQESRVRAMVPVSKMGWHRTKKYRALHLSLCSVKFSLYRSVLEAICTFEFIKLLLIQSLCLQINVVVIKPTCASGKPYLKQVQEGQEIDDQGLQTLQSLEEERVMGCPWSHCKGCPLLSCLSSPAIHLAFQYWQSDLFKAKCKLCTQALVGMSIAAILPSFIFKSTENCGKLLLSSIFISIAQLLTFMIAVLSGVKNVSWFSRGKRVSNTA